MDREALLEGLHDVVGDHGVVSDRVKEMIGQIVDDMAADPRNVGDEPEVYYRTVLVVEVLSLFAPFEGRLTDLGREVAEERVRAAVLAEMTERVTNPARFEAAKPVLTVAEYLALDAAGRAEAGQRVGRAAQLAARVPAGMLLAEAAEAIRKVWPSATTVIFEVDPWDNDATGVHAVQAGDTVLWNSQRGSIPYLGDDKREDRIGDDAYDLSQLVRSARDWAPDILATVVDNHYAMAVDEWLRSYDLVTEPAADAVPVRARFFNLDGSERDRPLDGPHARYGQTTAVATDDAGQGP